MKKDNKHHLFSVLLVFLFILFCSPVLFALRPYQVKIGDPLPEIYRWQSFPELSNRKIICMTEGPDQAFWFGTADEGVLRHDGFRCINMGLSGSSINQVIVSKNKTVLAATDYGIFQFNQGNWNRLFPPKEGMCWSIYDFIECADSSLWAGTLWGAVSLKNGEAMLYTTKDIADAFGKALDPVRITLVPEFCALEKQWKTGKGMDLAAGPLFDNEMTVRLIHKDGAAFAAGVRIGDRISVKNRSFSMYSGKPEELIQDTDTLFLLHPGESKPLETRISGEFPPPTGSYRLYPATEVYEDRAGYLWFGLGEEDEGKVVRFHRKRKEWKVYTTRDCSSLGGGISGKRMVQDNRGHLWMVSNIGTSCFDGIRWKADVPGENVWGYSVLKTGNGALWLGGSAELYLNSNGDWKQYHSPDVPIPDHPLFLYESSDGAVWMIGIGEELVRLDYRTPRWTIFTDLNFQCETANHFQWFLSRDRRVVRFDGKRWISFGAEDGLMDNVQKLLLTRDGELWAVGTHRQTAGVARFDGNVWTKSLNPLLTGNPSLLTAFESMDGSIWIGASWQTELKRRGGWGAGRFTPLLRRQTYGNWTGFFSGAAPKSVSSIGQSKDGTLWFGGDRLFQFNGVEWKTVMEPEFLADSIMDLFSSSDGDLYVGTQSNGMAVYDGSTWKQYTQLDGLADNKITGIFKTKDGCIWAATEKGISRFDDTAWITFGLPRSFRLLGQLRHAGSSLKQSADLALWINQESRTVRFQPSANTPETSVLSSFDKVPSQGNTLVQWVGIDLWHMTPPGEMQFSSRLDQEPWSSYTSERQLEFLGLKSGRHTVEVRARNMDFNADPTPAQFTFTVEPPVWKQWWFVFLFSVLSGSVLFEAAAILKRNRNLNRTNIELMEKTRRLKQARDDISQKAETLERYNKELQTFAYVASHDLQEPLRLISNYVSLLSMKYKNKLDKDADEFIGYATEGARRAQQLINDLLTYFRIGTQEKTLSTVSLDDVMKKVLRNLKTDIEKDEAIITVDPLPQVKGDEKQLENLIYNLMENAIKYRRKNIQPVVRIAAYDQNGHWHFTVQDNGIGISREYFDRVFELFQRLHTREEYGGTGIGLAVCKKIVERHGGKIWIESEVNHGSIFHFTLLKETRA